jgi:hypothetical protein
MKKLMIALCAAVMGASAAHADFLWNWWTTSNADKAQKTKFRGCSLGIASELKEVRGAQLDLLFNKSKAFKSGVQGAFGYAQTEKLNNGVQMAFVNKAQSSALQLGLVCINDTGFLPVFVFFNFDAKMFGKGK